MWELDHKEGWVLKNWCFQRVMLENTLALNIHWKDWCWSWRSNTLAIWCKAQTHWKRPWCWKRLRTGEGDYRWWDDEWYHQLKLRHEFEKTQRGGEGQESLACCSTWGRKTWTWLSDWITTPLTKISYIDLSPLPLWSYLSELFEVLSTGLQPSFCTK